MTMRMRCTFLMKGLRLVCFLLFHLFTFSPLFAQFNTDRLVMIGRSALYYEDYVLSIQYFNQAISQKPWLYEPWFFRGVAKYYLDDYRGAESDCSEAIELLPVPMRSEPSAVSIRRNIQRLSATMTVPCAMIPRTKSIGTTAFSVWCRTRTMTMRWLR